MTVHKLNLLLILSLGLSSATWAQKEICSTKVLAKAYGLNDSMLAIWRLDKYGCNKQRLVFLDSLFKLERLINIPKKLFLILYGIPDDFGPNGTLIYRNVMHCDHKNIAAKETSSLDVVVFFQDDRLTFFEKTFVD
ncbi:MAG: hypothetical protein WKF88_01340 [Ferruginibacter sp.]